MIRKQGKLPGKTVRFSYDLEYGTDTIEIQEDAVAAGQRVVVLDDLLATGGTMQAAIDLVRQRGGVVAAAGCIIELSFLHGRSRIDVPVHLDGRLRLLIVGQSSCHGPAAETATDHRIERVAAARRGAVQAANVAPIAGLGKMMRDQAQMPGVVEKTPAADGAGRQATIRKGHDQRRARLQHATDFADDLAGPRQMLDRDANRGSVELASRRMEDADCGSNPAPATRRETGSPPARTG